MARFKGKDLYLKDDDQAYFGDNQEAALWYIENELRLDHTISGTWATQGYHLVRKDQVPDDFLDLIDTPTTYSGQAGTYVAVKQTEDGLEFVTVSGIEAIDSFLDLTDTPTTYSGAEGKFVRVDPNNPTQLIFAPAIVGVTSSGTAPPDPDESNLWYNTTYNEFFYYDPNRDDWLGLGMHNYLYTRQGNIDGLYMSVGDLRHAEAHFFIPRPATITAVISSAEEIFNSSKGFEIRDTIGNTLFSFSHTNWEYNNMATNIEIDQDTKLRAFCVSAGDRCRNPSIMLEIRWRFEA